jgi:hypothetical protein
MKKKILYENFFPKTFEMDKILADEETITFITKPQDTKQICSIVQSYINKYISHEKAVIIDATACIGGDTIAFSKCFHNVISIEMDKQRYEYLKNNINVYKLQNVQHIHGNCIDVINKLPYFDIIYFDPPWGGKDYKEHINLRLSICDIPIENLVLDFFDANKSLCIPKLVVMKLPLNYDLKYITQIIGVDEYNIYLNKLHKFFIITVERK